MSATLVPAVTQPHRRITATTPIGRVAVFCTQVDGKTHVPEAAHTLLSEAQRRAAARDA